MRRAVPIFVTTAAGLALLASFHTNASPSATVAATAPETTAATTSTTTRRSAPTTPRTTVPVTKTVVGGVASTRFGPVQVQLTLQGARILDVQAIQMPSSHPRSQRISDEAAPMLRSEVLQAQSARINLISGASYTSQGYAESVQSALDRAGV